MRGLHIASRVLHGRGAVVMLGPYVIKRFAGADAPRKFFSEVHARSLLTRAGVPVVPILWSAPRITTFVMPRASATLNHELDAARLASFGEHAIELAQLRLPDDEPAGYYWLDTPSRRVVYRTFIEFLLAESGVDDRAVRSILGRAAVNRIEELFASAQPAPPRLPIPTDIAPKNVVLADGRFTHLDLEGVLIGPPEFLLVKAAINLSTDIGGLHSTPAIVRRLLAQCTSAENVRASLAFAFVRRLRFEARAGRRDDRPTAALAALLDGEPAGTAMAQLEASWDAGASAAM